VVFEADAAKLGGEREQEFVAVVVARSEQLYRLIDHAPVRFDLFGRGGKVARAVGEDIEADIVAEIPRLVVAPGEHRAVDERFEIGLGVAERVAGAHHAVERGDALPAFGQRDRRAHANLPRVVTRRVERDRLPLQVQHFRRHADAALIALGGREILEARSA